MNATFCQRPLTMLFLSICGMAIGLAIDSGTLLPDAQANLCLARAAGSVLTHLRILPATHGLMLLGALVGAAVAERPVDQSQHRRSIAAGLIRHLPDAIGAIVMTLGMLAGGFFGSPLIARLGIVSSFTALIGAMMLGMAAGMILATPIYRSKVATTSTSAENRN